LPDVVTGWVGVVVVILLVGVPVVGWLEIDGLVLTDVVGVIGVIHGLLVGEGTVTPGVDGAGDAEIPGDGLVETGVGVGPVPGSGMVIPKNFSNNSIRNCNNSWINWLNPPFARICTLNAWTVPVLAVFTHGFWEGAGDDVVIIGEADGRGEGDEVCIVGLGEVGQEPKQNRVGVIRDAWIIGPPGLTDASAFGTNRLCWKAQIK
jgi:hypothetical protein